jgi:hypothetical protein
MAETQIRFEDGRSYEQYMGDWSRRVGTGFIDWLALPSGLSWIDVGCGNGAFTERIVDRCASNEVRGLIHPTPKTRLCTQSIWRASGQIRSWGRDGTSILGGHLRCGHNGISDRFCAQPR